MAHTTLASTDRSLEKIGEFVPLQCIIFGALAERVAAAPDGSQLVEDLWNDFPHLMTSADDDAATMCGCFH